MESQNSMQQMTALLKHETTLCDRLLAALNAEHEALKQHSPEQLDATVQQKLACVSALEHNEQALFQMLSHCGFHSSADGLRQFLDSQAAAGDPLNINRQWETLLCKIAECKDLNQINGRVLNASLASTQQVLNLLSGREPVGATYNHSGKADDDNDSNRSLAIA